MKRKRRPKATHKSTLEPKLTPKPSLSPPIWEDGSFFASGPWASHQINLTQHSALDVCLQQIQIAIEVSISVLMRTGLAFVTLVLSWCLTRKPIEVDWKHELDQVEDYPKADPNPNPKPDPNSNPNPTSTLTLTQTLTKFPNPNP